MDKELVLKAWEVFQGLAKGLGDSCWKIRSVFYTASSGLTAYAFVHSEARLYWVVAFLSVIFFILESGYKQVQDQYISKSLTIERTLNDLLVGEAEPFLPSYGISTSISKPTMRKCFATLKHRNLFFWLPYLLIFLGSIVLASIGPEGHESPSKVILVTDGPTDSKQSARNPQSVPLGEWQRIWGRAADALDETANGVQEMAHRREASVCVLPTGCHGAWIHCDQCSCHRHAHEVQ